MAETGPIEAQTPQNWIGIRMTDSPGNPEKAGDPPNDRAVPSAGRRRLLCAGISTAPVIMTVMSRPVLAQANGCQSPSGFESGNASRPDLPACSGLTPGYWKQDQWFGNWPPPYYPTTVTTTTSKGFGTSVVQQATLFKDVLLPDLPKANLTFLQVLDPQSSGAGAPYNVARHIVATLLNIAAGKVPATALDKTRTQDIWNQYRTYGYYKVGSAIWYEEQIISYLKTTMPL
jgi:hypothetical protein